MSKSSAEPGSREFRELVCEEVLGWEPVPAEAPFKFPYTPTFLNYTSMEAVVKAMQAKGYHFDLTSRIDSAGNTAFFYRDKDSTEGWSYGQHEDPCTAVCIAALKTLRVWFHPGY